MSELEALISKHLDGELSPSELIELRRLLASSPDAQAVYREMTAIRRAARRTPTLHQPSAATEARLFHRLGAAGLRDVPAMPGSARSSVPVRRGLVATASMLAVALVALIMSLPSRIDEGAIAGEAPARPSATSSPSREPAANGQALRRAPSIPATPSAADVGARRAPELAAGRPAALDAAALDAAASDAAARGAAVRGAAERVADASDAAERMAAARVAASSDALADGARTVNTRENDIPLDSGAPSDPAAQANSVSDTAATEPSLAASDHVESIELLAAAEPRLLPIPGERPDPSILSAAMRFGTSMISEGVGESAQDLSVGLDFKLGAGHHLALVAGRSAAVTEQRAYNTHSVPARALSSDVKDGDGAGLQRIEKSPEPYDLEVSKEWWAGLGYTVTIAELDMIEVGLSARGGIGTRSLRAGLEVPVRMNVTERFALEVIGTSAYVVPHTVSRNEFSVQSSSDGYLYEAESEHTAFSTYGISFGLRFALD